MLDLSLCCIESLRASIRLFPHYLTHVDGSVKLIEGNKEMSCPLSSNIMNLCGSYQLSKAENEVLERGLTLTLTSTF